MSTLLLIPWIIFSFRHPNERFIGLIQTRKNIVRLFIVEIIFWTVLVLLLDKSDPNVAGQGSFAWMYQIIYEKGIFPTFLIADTIGSSIGDKIDSDFKFVYLLVALVMDYIILFLISPRLTKMFAPKRI